MLSLHLTTIVLIWSQNRAITANAIFIVVIARMPVVIERPILRYETTEPHLFGLSPEIGTQVEGNVRPPGSDRLELGKRTRDASSHSKGESYKYHSFYELL
jgi:hypothetical protein